MNWLNETLADTPFWVAILAGFGVSAVVWFVGWSIDKARERRWDRELEAPAPVREASWFFNPHSLCGCMFQTNAAGEIVIDEKCEEHRGA